MAYVDNDPVVFSHLNARVAKGTPGVTVVAGDVREVPVILDGVRAEIDLSVPVCLIMGFLLHFFTADAARDLVARYTAALAPGSLLVLSAIHVDTKGADEGFAGYSNAVAPVYNHSAAEFASFLDSLEILPPGVVDARMWCARTASRTLGSVISTPSSASPVYSWRAYGLTSPTDSVSTARRRKSCHGPAKTSARGSTGRISCAA